MEDLLFLSHRVPYPPDKGEKIRAWHFFRHLTERYRVHLACFVDDPADIDAVTILENICATVFCRQLVPLRAKMRSLPALLRGASLTEGYFHDSSLQRAIGKIIVEHRPQRLFVFSSAMAPYAERQQFGRYILDMVDVDSEKWRDYAIASKAISRMIYIREANKLLELERRSASYADATVFVSRAEADVFRNRAPEVARRVTHINNGVDTTYFDPAIVFPNPFSAGAAVVFIGAMNYRPNVDAVVWFVREVMPRLRLAGETLSFWIVGSNPSPTVRRLVGPDVFVTGRVPDVRPYLAHAAAVVAPLRIARGIQNKVLEAMAMSAPVIVSPQAREGLDSCSADELMEAGDPTAFVEAIVGLLRNRMASTIGVRARHRVVQDYSWKASFEALDALLEPACRPSARLPSSPSRPVAIA